MSEYCFWQSVAAIVFGDGSESRLYPLTKRRSEGAIPMAANYRLIDAVVSNCINSNINKIYALTQFNSTSLNLHLSKAYSGVFRGKEGFVEVIAAYQSPEDQGWFEVPPKSYPYYLLSSFHFFFKLQNFDYLFYQGNADAIRRCLWVLEEHPVTEFLVLPGHHLYKMDYQKLIKAHRNSNADITIVALNAKTDQDPGFGLLKVNSENQLIEFSIKAEKETISSTSVSCSLSNYKTCFLFALVSAYLRSSHLQAKYSSKSNNAAYGNIPSMGIYLINRDIMSRLVNEHFPEANDFGSEVIPAAISIGMKVRNLNKLCTNFH